MTVSRPQFGSLRLRAEGRRLRDALGREVILRGVNAGGRAKLPPFIPFAFREGGAPDAPPFDEAVGRYAGRIASWGCNLVRLPFPWEAVEPQRGLYSESWLHLYERIARELGLRGIRVIVDCHQDIFARAYGGSGFPSWALPADDDPAAQGEVSLSHWFEAYLRHPGVRRAFDRFWADEDGLLERYVTMWRKVARQLGAVDAVIGFEPINEPGWGTADWRRWAGEVLVPFYGRIARELREEAPDALVFFDATGADALAGETALTRPEGDGLVFAPHSYDGSVALSKRYDGARDYADALAAWEARGEAWNVPVLLGEFGVPADTAGGAAYLRSHYDALDRFAMHGTVWEYSEDPTYAWNDEAMSIVAPDGEETPLVDAVVRPYPRAVAGELGSFHWDPDAHAARLEWTAIENGTTEVAAPERLFPDGARVQLEGVAGEAAHDREGGVVVVWTKAAGAARLTVSRA